MVERQTLNLNVGGSIPSSGSNSGYLNILEHPLVGYAGFVSSKGNITFYGHKHFIPGWKPADKDCVKLLEKFQSGKLYLVWGDLSNPYFSWPIYAVKS